MKCSTREVTVIHVFVLAMGTYPDGKGRGKKVRWEAYLTSLMVNKWAVSFRLLIVHFNELEIVIISTPQQLPLILAVKAGSHIVASVVRVVRVVQKNARTTATII